MLAALDDSATPERLGDLLAQLGEAVSAHVEFEESELFPAMRSCGVDGSQLATAVQQSVEPRSR
jgi:iron-sulfur cluster repair protein YtfE (RIC family)